MKKNNQKDLEYIDPKKHIERLNLLKQSLVDANMNYDLETSEELYINKPKNNDMHIQN